MSPPEEFKTEDPTLVAWLKYRGFEPKKLQLERADFYSWVFADSDELRDEIDTYMDEDAMVEPRKFSLIIRETHRELSIQKNPRQRTA